MKREVKSNNAIYWALGIFLVILIIALMLYFRQRVLLEPQCSANREIFSNNEDVINAQIFNEKTGKQITTTQELDEYCSQFAKQGEDKCEERRYNPKTYAKEPICTFYDLEAEVEALHSYLKGRPIPSQQASSD